MPEKKVVKPPDAITAVTLKGFKSFADETRLEIRPLTLLAGANSSGKSSAMQPLLLMKQTEEASFDPGPLLLHDSHVRFTSADQVLTKLGSRASFKEFFAGFETANGFGLTSRFLRRSDNSFDLREMHVKVLEREVIVDSDRTDQSPNNLPFLLAYTAIGYGALDRAGKTFPSKENVHIARIFRNQGVLEVSLEVELEQGLRVFDTSLRAKLGSCLRPILHVPGLRGNPERAYRRTAAGDHFPGTFETYTASIIASWEERRDRRIEGLGRLLEQLGLSWKAEARLIDAAQVELLVGRLPRERKGGADLVNIADVGFGVSQVLPVLVALLAADSGQLVYLEQPELHLHPRAQQALATVLAEAASRGVQVVAETHSSTLLLAVQTLVAQGKLDPGKVILHWFKRDQRGATKVTSANLDEHGAYGDWPEDFAEVEAELEGSYLKAVEERAFGKRRKRTSA